MLRDLFACGCVCVCACVCVGVRARVRARAHMCVCANCLLPRHGGVFSHNQFSPTAVLCLLVQASLDADQACAQSSSRCVCVCVCCVPRNPFNHAPTARFNIFTFPPLRACVCACARACVCVCTCANTSVPFLLKLQGSTQATTGASLPCLAEGGWSSLATKDVNLANLR